VVADSGAEVTIPSPTEYQANYILLTEDEVAILVPSPELGHRWVYAGKQDGVGGRVPAFSSGVGWAGGTPPTWSTTQAAVDVVEFGCFDGVSWSEIGRSLGIIAPSPDMEVVQTGMISGSGGTTQLTFAQPIGAGNGVLMCLARATPDLTEPTGGGCDNWTLVKSSTSGYNQVWLGTSSTGGSGSEVLHYAISTVVEAVELAGVNADPEVAIDATVLFEPTSTENNQHIDIPGVVTPSDGSFVGMVIANYLTDAGQGNAEIPPLVAGAAGTWTYNGYQVWRPTNYQGNPAYPLLVYKTNSVEGDTYFDEFQQLIGGAAGGVGMVIMFALRS
jgi:hypothetical protein